MGTPLVSRMRWATVRSASFSSPTSRKSVAPGAKLGTGWPPVASRRSSTPFASHLASSVGITPAMRVVPYRIERGLHWHGIQVSGRVPAHTVALRSGVARGHLVGAECRVLAGLAQGSSVLR